MQLQHLSLGYADCALVFISIGSVLKTDLIWTRMGMQNSFNLINWSNLYHFCYAIGRRQAVPGLVQSSLFRINNLELTELVLLLPDQHFWIVWLRWF